MKSHVRITTLLCLLMLIFTASCEESIAQTKNSAHSDGADLVKTVIVTRPSREERALKITEGVALAPREVSKIIPETGGRFIRYYVSEHQFVKKGRRIARIDATDYRLQLESAKMQRAALEAQFASLQKTYDRVHRLLQEEAVPQQEFDSVKGQYEAMQRQIEAAAKQVDLLKRQVAKAILRAPFSGEITALPVAPGQLMAPGHTNVATIKMTDSLEVRMSISEIYYSEIRNGMKISFFIPSLNRTVNGIISSKSSSINTMKKFTVICRIDNTDRSIPAGTYAVATVSTEKKSRLLVPPTAIRQEKTGAAVFTVSDGSVRKKPVITGFSFESGVEVLGDMPDLVVSDASSVSTGEKVDVTIK